MRKKYINQVYMKEVKSFDWYLEENKDFNGYIALKHIKKMSRPIMATYNGFYYVGLDENYSIMEYVPQNRGYNCRVFFDDDSSPILFYFDINNGVGIDDGMPWYDDLYLDVIMRCPKITNGKYLIQLDDKNEFVEAYNNGNIDKMAYVTGRKTAFRLIAQLKEQRNDIVNRCQDDFLRIRDLMKK